MIGKVDFTVSNGIGVVSFYHPAHNSMPGALLMDLTEAIKGAGRSDAVQVVVLRSEGERTFCAGASFDELIELGDFGEAKAFFLGFANVINAMRTCPKLIIGRIHGRAIGGGVGLAAAADYAIATQYSTIKLSELAIGIGPFVIGPAVERKMGKSAFSELAINAGEWRTAEWAKSKGLYNEVFETVEQVDAYITHLGERLAGSSPAAMGALKRVLWEGTEAWDTLLAKRAEESGRLVLTRFAKEAIQAFKNK